jgi:hypothetical protein
MNDVLKTYFVTYNVGIYVKAHNKNEAIKIANDTSLGNGEFANIVDVEEVN